MTTVLPKTVFAANWVLIAFQIVQAENKHATHINVFPSNLKNKYFRFHFSFAFTVHMAYVKAT